ncbi:MAG: sensor histidine kinase [Flavipsychrobacter sp.]
MRYYFFNTPSKEYSRPFRQFAIKQNIGISNILAYTTIATCVLIFICKLFFDFGLIVNNPREYRDVLIFLLTGSTIYLIAGFIIKRTNIKRRLKAYWIATSYYAVVIIGGFTWLTFIAQHNPGNTMTMFMAGLFGVGVLWIFDFWGTLIISILTFSIFSISLNAFQTNRMVLWENYIVSFVVIMLFFIISRILYSSHFRYFIQLRTTEEKSKEIQKMSRAQTEILDMVAHDLRSPLNSIAALIELIKHPTSTEAEKKEYYDLILASCKNSDTIIQDLIDTAKKRDNKSLPVEGISLNSFLSSIRDQWIHRMPANKRLVYSGPQENIIAPINQQKMQRVIDNLINNAIKFTPPDGIIEMALQPHNDNVRISIKDNGIGIPKDLHPYLFDRFSKAGRTGLDGEKSYGLGLSICQQIVEQHGGSISVDSREAQGTTFNIDIPQNNNQ